MITYRKGFPSPYSLLVRLHGAAWIRTLLPAVVAALLTIVLNLFVSTKSLEPGKGWIHPYTYSNFSYIVGFAIVFRNNSAYQRFNQARNDLQVVSGKLVESAVQVCSFDLITSKKEGFEGAAEKSKEFRRAYIHLVSLLHGLMLQYLRSDWNLENLCPHVPGAHPQQDSGKLPNTKNVLFTWSYWSTVLCLQTSQLSQEVYNSLTPLLVVGGIDEEEKSSLYPLMDGGDLYLGHLAPAAVRVETAYSWLHRLMLARFNSGGLQVSPPILSRSYQVLNDALNAYNQLRGLADIPFPFPYSNAIVLILCIYTLTLPLLMWIWIKSTWFGALLAFITTFTYWTLNEIARDLEVSFFFYFLILDCRVV